MKKVIFGVLSVLFLSSLALAAELVPAKVLRLNVKDSSTDYSQIEVRVSWNCFYQSGFVWAETKSCKPKNAVSNMTITSDTNGVVKIPAIQKFSGARASSLKNYEIDYAVYYKNKKLFFVGARGTKEIKSLVQTQLDLTVTKIESKDIRVSVEGEAIPNSARAKIERASLSASITVKNRGSYLDESFAIFSGSYNQAFENHPVSSTPKLTAFEKLAVPDLYIAYLGATMPMTRLFIAFSEPRPDIPTVSNMTHRFVLELQDSPDALQGLDVVDLPRYIKSIP